MSGVLGQKVKLESVSTAQQREQPQPAAKLAAEPPAGSVKAAKARTWH